MFRHQDHFVTKPISRFVTKNRSIRHQESVDSSPSRKVLQNSLNVDRNYGIVISRQAVIVTRLKMIGFSMLSVMSEIPIFKRLSWENTSEMEHFRIISVHFRMLQCAKRRQFMEYPRQVAAERETNSHAVRTTIERQPSWISRQFPVLPPSAHYGLSSSTCHQWQDSTFVVSVDVFCSLS